MCATEGAEDKKENHSYTPRKVFPYMSIKKSLENLLNRPGFVDKYIMCCGDLEG